MRSSDNYPDFAVIEAHIRRARLERSVVLGQYIADFAKWLGASARSLATVMQRGYEAECDRRAIEADAFLRRSVPH